MTHTALTRFLDRVPVDVPVVLDEAYHHFVAEPGGLDGMRLLARWPNLVVLRTFSKAYGLAGPRVGFGVSGLELAAALRKVTLPFAVSSVGTAAAAASLRPAAREERACDVRGAGGERRVPAGRGRAGLIDATGRWLCGVARGGCLSA